MTGTKLRRQRILLKDTSTCKVPPGEPVMLSVITLNIPGRERTLAELRDRLLPQIGEESVEWLVHSGPEHYGTEMRRSCLTARGEYVAYVDDDDLVEQGYVAAILGAIRERRPDVVTFGSYTPNCPPAWLRANRPDNSGVGDEGNVKTANHYCAWRRDVWLRGVWLPRNYGAEYAWYTGLRLAYPEITEAHVHECLHVYRWDPAGTKCQDRASIGESLSDGGHLISCYKNSVTGEILLEDANGKVYDHRGDVRRVDEFPSGSLVLLERFEYR